MGVIKRPNVNKVYMEEKKRRRNVKHTMNEVGHHDGSYYYRVGHHDDSQSAGNS